MKIALALAGLLAMASGADATSLTTANFVDTVGAKDAFIKFQAPWWGHCKSMKPAWDQLMKAHESAEFVVVGDVDCTADDSKDLCGQYGVRGYPTIKYFTGATGPEGASYEGGRTFEDLNKFVAESGTFGPSCGQAHPELCDADQTASLEKFVAMSATDRAAKVKELDAEFAAIEENFKASVQKLQDTYQGLMDAKEKDAATFKENNPHLGIMKGIKSADNAEL